MKSLVLMAVLLFTCGSHSATDSAYMIQFEVLERSKRLDGGAIIIALEKFGKISSKDDAGSDGYDFEAVIRQESYGKPLLDYNFSISSNGKQGSTSGKGISLVLDRSNTANFKDQAGRELQFKYTVTLKPSSESQSPKAKN